MMLFVCIAAVVGVLVAGLPGDDREDIKLEFDIEGRKYLSLDSMVQGEVGWSSWYTDHFQLWKNQTSDIDLMVEGGRANSFLDLKHTKLFLEEYFPEAGRGKKRALDLGSGMGRVAKGALLNFVKAVDLVDVTPQFLMAAQRLLHGVNMDGKYTEAQIKDHKPPRETYDLICLQWVTQYMADRDILTTLRNMMVALKPNGVLFIKENMHPQNPGEVLVQDARIIRPSWYYEQLFGKAGLKILKHQRQVEWTEQLPFAVGMWVVAPGDVTVLPPSDPATGAKSLPVMGHDLHEGHHFYSLRSMWDQELHERNWYEHNKQYWDQREAKINNPEIAPIDMPESLEFLQPFFNPAERYKYKALDLGAGVGRVVQGVLLKLVYSVDLVDQGAHFLWEAKNRLNRINPGGAYIESSLQNFRAEPRAYDLICMQFTALYMFDDDLVTVMRRLLSAIKPNGFIFFKDSYPKDDTKFQINRDSGHNIVRTQAHYQWIFREAGWRVAAKRQQKTWLEGANPVMMWMLRPIVEAPGGEGGEGGPQVLRSTSGRLPTGVRYPQQQQTPGERITASLTPHISRSQKVEKDEPEQKQQQQQQAYREEAVTPSLTQRPE